MTAEAPAAAAGRIGPNAITRVAQVLPAFRGAAFAEAVFARAGLAAHWREPPQRMVREDEVRALHRTLRAALPADEAAAVARAAGSATADYLLAHRIPRPVQWLLTRLPEALASRLLLRAIAHHAWTFAGSGRFTATPAAGGRPARLEIRGNPLCRGVVSERPCCDYYAATFERLFQVLVHPRSRVVEVACEALGDTCCRFELRHGNAQGHAQGMS